MSVRDANRNAYSSTMEADAKEPAVCQEKAWVGDARGYVQGCISMYVCKIGFNDIQ